MVSSTSSKVLEEKQSPVTSPLPTDSLLFPPNKSHNTFRHFSRIFNFHGDTKAPFADVVPISRSAAALGKVVRTAFVCLSVLCFKTGLCD